MFFAFFAFNKQAFCNYYHFVIAALCCAIAAARAVLPSGRSLARSHLARDAAHPSGGPRHATRVATTLRRDPTRVPFADELRLLFTLT